LEWGSGRSARFWILQCKCKGVDSSETVLFVIEKQFPLLEASVVKTPFTISITEFDSFSLVLKMQHEIRIPVPRMYRDTAARELLKASQNVTNGDTSAFESIPLDGLKAIGKSFR
jgi:hypothetical protein